MLLGILLHSQSPSTLFLKYLLSFGLFSFAGGITNWLGMNMSSRYVERDEAGNAFIPFFMRRSDVATVSTSVSFSSLLVSNTARLRSPLLATLVAGERV